MGELTEPAILPGGYSKRRASIGRSLAFTSPLVSWIRRGFVPPLLRGPREEIAEGHASTISDVHDFRIPPPETPETG